MLSKDRCDDDCFNGDVIAVCDMDITDAEKMCTSLTIETGFKHDFHRVNGMSVIRTPSEYYTMGYDHFCSKIEELKNKFNIRSIL